MNKKNSISIVYKPVNSRLGFMLLWTQQTEDCYNLEAFVKRNDVAVAVGLNSLQVIGSTRLINRIEDCIMDYGIEVERD